MNPLGALLLLATSATAFPAVYTVPYNDTYSYVVNITDGKLRDLFLAEKSGNTLEKIPQTVRIEGRTFSILCDLKMKAPGGKSGIGLANLKGEVEITKNLAPRIGKSAGTLQKK